MTEVSWFLDPRYDAGLDRLAELQRQESRLFAERARVLAGLVARTSRADWQAEAPFDALLLDVAGTCVLGQTAAGSRLLDAEHLVVRLPGTVERLEEGSLAVHQAQVLVAETRELAPEVCGEVEHRVLPQAGLLAPADLRRLVRRVVLEVDAAEQERREAAALARRRVWVKPVEDGMALLCGLLPAEQAQRAFAALSEQARAAGRVPGEQRCADELRADLLAELLAGGDLPGSSRPVQVVVQVPVAVALGLSDAPADLSGHGPISAAHARRVLDGPVELRRACVDPTSGEVWALDDKPVRVRRSSQPTPTPRATPTPSHVEQQRESGQAAQLLPDWATVPSAGGASPPPTRAVVEHQVEAEGQSEGEGQVARSVELEAGVEPQVAGQGRSRPQRRDDLRAALLALLHASPPTPLPPEPQHDPSAALARLVRARDGRCDGIGCSVPSSRCELDHLDPWPEGETSADNLRPRSQRCHHAKHSGWTTDTHTDSTRWTSPGGRRYTVPRRGPALPPDVDLAARRRAVVA